MTATTSRIELVLEGLATMERSLTGPTGERVMNAYPHTPADIGSEKCPFFLNEIAGPAPIVRAAFGTYKITDRIRAVLAVARRESGPSIAAAELFALAWRDTLIEQLPKFLHLNQPDFVSEVNLESWNMKSTVPGTTEYIVVEFIIGVVESFSFDRGV